ncbi:MAG: thymidine kinase [Acholeplasmatales bacterium]|jgi:thymidine kinase|nr:thymidine kinase [Acholeplasmatales bacterium]
MDKKAGSIEIVCGPMFAGKTEELIRRIRRLDYAKKKYLVFKPSIDKRYSNESEIVSHNLRTCQAILIDSSSEIEKYITSSINAVIIDEAQFFDDGLIKVVDNLADLGIRVIVGGLDRNFRGQPFGPMGNLLAIAENVTKLTAICVVCGEPATRTQRIINGKPALENDPLILVAAKESYEPRCRCHHEVPSK